MKRKRSFTLVELLAVMAIMTVIVAIAVFNISRLYAYEEKNEAEAFVRDLKYARRMALASNSDVRFTLEDGGKAYSIARERGPGDKGAKEVNLKRLRVIKLTNKKYDHIIFNKSGSVTYPCSFRLEGEDLYEVSVQVATGKVNLKELGD